MKILHLTHGLFGNNNGVDTYLRIFNKYINAKQYIIVPFDKYQNFSFQNVLTINSLLEIKEILKKYKPDFYIIHYTGQESFINNEKFGSADFNRGIIQMGDDEHTADFNPDAFLNTYLYPCDINTDINTIIINHADYKLPDYLCYPYIRACISVSKKVAETNKDIKTNNFIIYPTSELKEYKAYRLYDKSVNIGWLGRLSKYDIDIYNQLKTDFSGNSDINFIFAGKGKMDINPPDNFIFTGNMQPEKFFNEIDIFLYPTVIDSFSIALLESMFANKTSIASDIVSELANTNPGSYVYKNYVDMKKELLKQINLIKDNKNTENDIIKKTAYKKFSVENFSKQWARTFNYLLEECKWQPLQI